MNDSTTRPSTPHPAWIALLCATGYFVCARLSLFLVTDTEQITAIWPPAGLILGFFLALNQSQWKWICLGLLPALFISNLLAWHNPFLAIGFAVTDTLAPLLGAWLMSRIHQGPVRMQTLTELLSVILIGGIGISALSATGSTWFYTIDPKSVSHVSFWLDWWTSDLMGTLVVTPWFLSWYNCGPHGLRDVPSRKMGEGLLLMGMLLISIHLVFGRETAILKELGPIPFLLLPFFLWGALRFGVPMTTLVCLVSTWMVVTYTIHGCGPFASPDESTSEIVFRLQIFMSVVILSTLVVAVSLSERNQAMVALTEGEQLYRKAIEVAGAVPYYQNYATDEYEFVGDGIVKITGIQPTQFTRDLFKNVVQEVIPTGDLTGMTWEQARSESRRRGGRDWQADVHIRLPDGTEKWLANAAVQVRDEKGEAIASLGILQDITERKMAEQTLRESEKLYRSAIEGVGAVPYCRNFTINETGQRIGSYYSFLGHEIEKLTGYSTSEYSVAIFNESLIEEIIHESPDDLPDDEAYRRRLEQGGLRFRADYRIRHRSGEERWLEDASIEILDSQGRVTACLGILQDLTERKQNEEAVRRTDRLYRTAIEGIGAVPYYRNFGSNKYIYIGSDIEKLTGYTTEEFTTNLLDSIIVDRIYYGDLDGLTLNEAVQKVRNTVGSQWRADYHIHTPDGKDIWLADSAVQVGDQSGKTIGSLGILQNITDRVRIGESLRIRDRAIHSAVNGVLITDWLQPDNPTVFVNPAFERITGYTAEEFIGKNPRILQREDRDQPEIAILRDAITKGNEAKVVLRNYRKDDTLFWVELSIAPVRDENGKITHFIGIQNDITDRVRMEKQQSELTDGLRAVVDMADELLTCPDEDTLTRRAVELAREKLGLERCSLQWLESKTLIGTYGTDLNGNTTDERNCRNPLGDGWMANLRSQSKTNLQWYLFESDHVEWNGNELIHIGEGWTVLTPLHSNQKWFGGFFNDSAISGSPYNPVQQELLAVYCSLLANIIERRRSEENRRELEEQIHHAQKLESLGVLAGGIAHDFNNLLMGVLGNASLAMTELPVESPARESVVHIEQAALRAAELARQMLAYSGKGKFIIQRLDLSRIVEEMSHLLQVSISKKAFLRYNFAPDLPSVEGDPTQIRQVIMNLITNASDAIGDKSGIITINTGVLQADTSYLSETYLNDDLPEGYYVYVEVSDTGCGMDEETRARIFDPFFTTKFTGRGLGLAAALGIVRGHKGAIKVYSEVGRGTTIKILFPATDRPAEESINTTENPDREWKPSGTILLVDDEETVRTVCRRILEGRGFQVLTAEDGLEGVEMFRKAPDKIGLVLLDMTMPHMDGEEAFREMRKIRPDVRVILTSGYSEQDATGRFSGKGLAGFIQKPFSSSTLLEKIREILG